MTTHELIVEEIIEREGSTSVQLLIRRRLTTLEKLHNLSTLFKGFKTPFYKVGRVTFMSIDQVYLDRHQVKIGDDINDYDDITYNMMTLESTDKEVFEDEGIPYTNKYNPSTKELILVNDKLVYHSTFLIPSESFTGDVIIN